MSEKFTMTEEHLLLLQHMFLNWNDCEFGAPAVDPKRPYGNSDVIGDIMKILGKDDEKCPHCGEPLNDGMTEALNVLHRGTLTALQAALDTGAFKVGTYMKPDYGRWHYCGENGEVAQ